MTRLRNSAAYAALASLLAMISHAPRAEAQVELGAALRSLQQAGHDLPRSLLEPHGKRVGVLTEGAGTGLHPVWLFPEEVAGFVGQHPELQVHWAPPRHPLLDEASKWIGAATFRETTGLTGAGVVVGIVDTGLDVAHADLRDAAGKSRVRYMLDFSRPAAHLQPALEDEYGCTGDADCAIYSNDDLDTLLSNNVTGDEPRDTFGHGTHVASLAVGNGLSMKTPRYIGVAPEAVIIGARVSRAGDGTIQDADIIQATRFVFDQAEKLGLPAVVNLSLGSDFGTHDGSSPLERGLAAFVGSDKPGRSIVVAAGNSGTLYNDTSNGEPAPLGIHTEVHVPRESPVAIPILTPTADLGAQEGGTIFIWLGFQPGDEVSVGVDMAGTHLVPDISPGTSTTYDRGSTQATVFNGPTNGKTSIKVGGHNAVVVIDGSFPLGTRFALRLSGHGTANLWIQATGGQSPDLGVGVLVPRGEKQGTINIPASNPDLIAVGATVNRNRWRDYKGKPFLVGQSEGSEDLLTVDAPAIFSAAGPNALGVIKPDIVAPGMFVIGALSAAADPRHNGGVGVFASQGRCGTPDYECFVTDDGFHAVTSGTSMSAPLVSGAIALLLERKPELTQPQLRTLLQAGARSPTGPVTAEQQVGPGELDLQGSLAAMIAEDSPLDRAPTRKSRIVLGSAYVHPDPAQPLQGLLELRDDKDRIADGFDERRLSLDASVGELTQAPTRLAPGLYGFELTAPEGSGGKSIALKLSYDGNLLGQKRLPIGTDRWIAEGAPLARGGCSFGHTSRTRSSAATALLGLLLLAVRRKARCAS